MGKGTDKLYITHSEWASEDSFSASVGSGASKSRSAPGASFKRLPFNFCSVSLQPFKHPVCTGDGTIFDLTNILPWLKKHGTNPVTGLPLKSSELIKLHFAKNDDEEYVDPVTYKIFTDNTHIVALRNTGNVFAYETIERLNIKAKMWRDLVSDAEFSRADIITLQDPQNVASRDLSSFKYIQDGVSTLTAEQAKERNETVNTKAMGSSERILKAKEAVEKARRERVDPNRNPASHSSKALGSKSMTTQSTRPNGSAHTGRLIPFNAAQHTTGKAAASFTSTGLTPHTSGERALLTDEEYMLKPKRVKIKGYARIQTNLGDLNVELQTEYAPKAVWNFVHLAKKGYYRGISFHRSIRNFMLQGGDPTGTGKGGTSIWGKNFNDEFEGPLTHDARGVISMANKGKNTNSSQFFITYRAASHLDRKHTIFGRVVGGLDVLSRIENVETDSSDRPTEAVTIDDIVVFIDPFEEFQKQKDEKDQAERDKEEIRKQGGTEDERVTWTGKRVRADGGSEAEEQKAAGAVGKYLHAPIDGEDEIVGEWDDSAAPPARKKGKIGGGFGNFDAW
ncbi:MAG: Peptidyl-prolyl cis-trans isomerase cyp8 [Sarcosagium campestre]|nr:MAG: Peptidyl-prolyl cis-trans isomerase cyp8 [Sarcosagium campestre]